MKVILTDDVEKLGGSNEVVDVAEGYARNYLLPRSLAIPATKSALANLDNMKRVAERRQARLRNAAQTEAAKLEGQTLVLTANIGSGGRLYGSIGTADIAAALKDQLGVEIDRKQVLLGDPIRSTGLYPVPVALHRDVKVQVLVQVGDVAPEPAAAGDTATEGAAAAETAAAS